MEAVTHMVQFQSTIEYSKNPPAGYQVAAVDLLGGLSKINDTVMRGGYDSQYHFEEAISQLLNSAMDGHLAFEGSTYRDTFQWTRALGLASVAIGDGLPEIYLIRDLNQSDTSKISPLTSINGQDPITFLEAASNETGYQDVDARWNAMFYRMAAQSGGYFIAPSSYPGNTTSLRFRNGTTASIANSARVLTPSAWASISDVQSFFNTCVSTSSSYYREKRALEATESGASDRVPRALEKRTDLSGYPTPFRAASGETMTELAGFFINHAPLGDIAVLGIQTFDADSSEAEAFQAIIRSFIAECQSRDVTKIIVDVSSNSGGDRYLRTDTFKQFFPAIDFFEGFKYRAHPAMELIGPYNWNLKTRRSASRHAAFVDWVDRDGEDFSSWQDLYGPVTVDSGNYTNMLRVDYNKTLIDRSVPITGYGQLSNYTVSPFTSDNIVIASLSHLFSYLSLGRYMRPS